MLCGAVQQRVDGGMLDMCSWVCDGHAGVVGRCELHGVCGGAVQQRVDGVVCVVWSWAVSIGRGADELHRVLCGVDHGQLGVRGRFELHGVLCGAVQQRVDGGV